MLNNIYCTYLTVYSGNKLPPFYIGSTTVHNIRNGYRGSVKSKKYKKIWTSEIQNNPKLFKTIILTTHSTREEAIQKELFFHRSLNVVKCSLYINQSFACPNGFFGTSLKGIPKSEGHKKNISKSKIGIPFTEERRKRLSYYRKGKKLSQQHIDKMTKSRIGKKWFYDPISLRHIKCFPENKPENFIAGRVFNKK